MRLIVGAPVANRAWAIPHWMACLAGQTRRPDGFVFVHSGQMGDDTWETILREADRHGFEEPWIEHDPSPVHPRQDNERFGTLARLRNEVLDSALLRGAELFLSLDTDIMLENPLLIERLEEMVTTGMCDIAQPVTFFHPHAPRDWKPGEQAAWAYNFGFFPTTGGQDPRRPWRRPQAHEIPWGKILRVHVPMGVWLSKERFMRCRYRWHEAGEDIGFAQSLEAAHAVVLADTSLYAFHAWDEVKLAEALA